MLPSKLFSHRVEIYTGTRKSYEKDQFTISEVEVLAENDHYMVLNDVHFTKLDKKRDKYFNCYPVPEQPSIDVHVDNQIWSDGVIFVLYSSAKWSSRRIEAAIRSAIDKKCGWMKSRVNFGILNKKESADA